MEKTKLGLSVAIMSAIVYLTALFGGYTPLLLVAGYILIVEENIQLKKTAITAFLILIAFSVVSFIIGLVPDIFSILVSFLDIFGAHDLYVPFFSKVANFLYTVLTVVKEVGFVFLAGLAFLKKPLNLSFVDKLFD